MKKFSFGVVVGVVLLLFVGCMNNIDLQNDKKEKTPKVIAENYVEKIISMDKIFSRAVNTEEYPDFLYEIEIEDENGNEIKFAEMSDEDKSLFFENWKTLYTEELTEKFIEDSELAEMVELENEAFFETLESNVGTRAAKNYDTENFISMYEKKIG